MKYLIAAVHQEKCRDVAGREVLRDESTPLVHRCEAGGAASVADEENPGDVAQRKKVVIRTPVQLARPNVPERLQQKKFNQIIID